jgi:membrane protease YdiL (CAAX protease family)
MSFIRLPLIIVGLITGWLVFRLLGDQNAWNASVSLTNFTLTVFADGTCLVLLLWRGRVEHFHLADLIKIDRKRISRDILIGLALATLFMILMQGFNTLAAVLVYGPGVLSRTTGNSVTAGSITPPLWVLWWGFLVLPITVGFIEEMVYRGYALPRLEAATHSQWLSLLIVSLGFGLQHIALPLVDWRTSLARFLGMLPIGLLFGWIYFKQRRLLPLIVAHWAVDFLGLGLLPLLAVLH